MTSALVISHLNAYWLPCAFLALGLLPGLAVARWLRLPSWFWLPLTLASAALAAYGAFWAYFFDPALARRMTPILVIGSALGFVVWVRRSPDVRTFLRERDAWIPGVLMFCLMVGYLACLAWPHVSVTARFTVPLPAEDYAVPRSLADNLYFGLYKSDTRPSLITLETRSSDRPPLQAAMVLSVRALGLGGGSYTTSDWTYEVLTTFCQMGWVPALYALCRTLNLTRRQLAFILIGTAFSGFFLVHSVFTWPKFLAAWLFLTALTVVLQVVRRHAPATAPVALAIGVLLALSLLAHGSPFFSIVALPVLVAQRHGWRCFTIRQTLAAALAGGIVLAPWIAYQRFYDPPGNRLVKLHLAGVFNYQDERSTLESLRDAYTQVGLRRWIAGRWENLKEQWLVFGKSGRSHPVEWVQWQQFFHHAPALDFLVLGFLGIAVRRRLGHATGPQVGVPQVTWYALAALLVWIVLLFPPGTAMVHHGSFATTALLFVGAAAYAALLPAWLGASILALHVTTFALVWLSMRTLANSPHHATWTPVPAVLMLVAFTGFVVVLLRSTRATQPP